MDSVTEAGLHKSLGELHAKVDILLTREIDHGKRLGSLEKKQWVISGGFAVFTLLVGPRIMPLLQLLPH